MHGLLQHFILPLLHICTVLNVLIRSICNDYDSFVLCEQMLWLLLSEPGNLLGSNDSYCSEENLDLFSILWYSIACWCMSTFVYHFYISCSMRSPYCLLAPFSKFIIADIHYYSHPSFQHMVFPSLSCKLCFPQWSSCLFMTIKKVRRIILEKCSYG